MFTSKLTLLRTESWWVLVVSLVVGYYLGCRLVQADPPCDQPLPLCEEGCTVTVFPHPYKRVASDLVPTHRVHGPGQSLYKCGVRRVYQGDWCEGRPTFYFNVYLRGCGNKPLSEKDPPSGGGNL